MAPSSQGGAPIGIPRSWMIIGLVVIVALIIISIIWGSYNNLVRLNQDVDRTFADAQAQYQRRFDLIPNLVSTVQGAANFEQGTIVEVTAMRSQWQSAQTSEQKVAAANNLEGALSKLLLISENYPQLTATANFQALQDSLAETENMIFVTRNRYNAAVAGYNSAVQVFPSNMIAGAFGFSTRSYFAASDGANAGAPQVNFTF